MLHAQFCLNSATRSFCHRPRSLSLSHSLARILPRPPEDHARCGNVSVFLISSTSLSAQPLPPVHVLSGCGRVEKLHYQHCERTSRVTLAWGFLQIRCILDRVSPYRGLYYFVPLFLSDMRVPRASNVWKLATNSSRCPLRRFSPSQSS